MKPENSVPEMQEKVETCKTAEELGELAEAESIELSEEDLGAIAGGTNKKIQRARIKRFGNVILESDPEPSTGEPAPGDVIRVF